MDQESKIWYVLIENQKTGPFTVDELLQEEPPIPEKLTKDSLVWKAGMISWLRAFDVPEFAALNPKYVKYVEEEFTAAAQEPVSQKSASSNSGARSPKLLKLFDFNTIIHTIVKDLKDSFENLRRNNPLAVIGTAVAAAIIFICFTSVFVYNAVENRREEKKLALEIAQRDRDFKERREKREQALRDSVERVELGRLKEIRIELQRRAALDSMAKLNARKKTAPSSQPSYPSFTDQRNGNIYRIGKFGNTTWFLQDLDYGRRFSWQQAAIACPKGWRLPGDREWRTLASILKDGAGSHFGSNYYWWSAVDDGADSWYVSGGSLVCYSGSDNRSAVYRVRCVKE